MIPCYQGGTGQRKWIAPPFDAERPSGLSWQMPFSPLATRKTAHEHPDSAPFGWYWERRASTLRRILAGGRWSVHDVINRPEIRQAVTTQWRLVRRIGRDREVDAYIRYLEYVERISGMSSRLPAIR